MMVACTSHVGFDPIMHSLPGRIARDAASPAGFFPFSVLLTIDFAGSRGGRAGTRDAA
jgi:hypothetical protein